MNSVLCALRCEEAIFSIDFLFSTSLSQPVRLSPTLHFVSSPFGCEVRTILVQVRAFYQRKIGTVWHPIIMHTEAFPFFVRCVFLVFVRRPNGRAETLGFLSS
jgi:hypothetical protein